MSKRGFKLSSWAIHHPVGVVMLTLAAVVLGIFAFRSLSIDLLPQIIYPDVRVRIIDPGVPATIMEDQVTRQLEEQLAVTEDAVHVESTTSEGRTSVSLSFEYSKDINEALRDASTRLDRAKRFLPNTIDPPTIYKRDPAQLPVMELLVSSSLRSSVEIREWADYTLSKWLLNLHGIAAVEVGGGLQREIQVIVDPVRLAANGVSINDLGDIISRTNQDISSGRLRVSGEEFSGRTQGRFQSVDELRQLVLPTTVGGRTLHLEDVADVIDGTEESRIRVRHDGLPGVRISLQRQPAANTVDVVTAVENALISFENSGLTPDDVSITRITDQASPIHRAIDNTMGAATGGAFLAMLVVYLFLGNLKRTLIIGSAIPVAIIVTFIMISFAGFNLNIMTLGGLALGVGMLVDSTIVMIENIHRHRISGGSATGAANEVSGAIFASTSTNLAAILPFLFLGGLVGLLFRELIFTISASIVAAMIVSLTLVPALAARLRDNEHEHALLSRPVTALSHLYERFLKWLLHVPVFVKAMLFVALAAVLITLMRPFAELPANVLPKMDEGLVQISLTADEGSSVDRMDNLTQQIEEIVESMPAVESLFTIVGGRIFGRSEYERANSASVQVQLLPSQERDITASNWVGKFQKKVTEAQIPGLRVRARVRSIRGISVSTGEDDLSLKIRGPDLLTLEKLGTELTDKLQELPGLRNLQHSSEEVSREVIIKLDRERASRFGLNTERIGSIVRIALDGKAVTTYYENDRSIDVVLRLKSHQRPSPGEIGNLQIFAKGEDRKAIRLSDVATITIEPAPASIKRDRQQRIVEVSAALSDDVDLAPTVQAAMEIASTMDLPEGYSVYESGSLEALKEGHSLGGSLLLLALFLVLVVMAVQYESLRNPLVILLGVPFAGIGVVIGLTVSDMEISMPIWIGMIMLAGIVVNNAIVLVETIEVQRRVGMERVAAISEAARLRLKPILMTTLTTVAGMMPLALSAGGGSEMLQPLAVVLISGLIFSTFVTLLMIPLIYQYLGNK